jgi:hypothetical protein
MNRIVAIGGDGLRLFLTYWSWAAEKDSLLERVRWNRLGKLLS